MSDKKKYWTHAPQPPSLSEYKANQVRFRVSTQGSGVGSTGQNKYNSFLSQSFTKSTKATSAITRPANKSNRNAPGSNREKVTFLYGFNKRFKEGPVNKVNY